jgi:3-deoxy-D-manno-octulosonic-acid transferase
VLLAGSTHEGDEGPILDAFTNLLAHYPDALLVLVPRHPERFSRSAQAAREHGLQVFLRSQGPACPAGTQCFVIDTMGELQRYYAACDIAFVGGSFEEIGGHNPLEPAALGRPVVVGPHTFNFAEITRQLLDCGAAIQVADRAGLEAAVRQLFDSPEQRDRMGRSGQDLVQREQGAVDRTLGIVDQLITRATG